MPRAGELTYYDQIGEAGREHAVSKPFSDDECGLYLLRAGALFSLLPPPPARVLDCGCGTGWLSYFLARRGYDVVGTDVSPHAIALARERPMFREGAQPQFQVADSERLTFQQEFDIVVFFDALHHAIDEAAALRGAWQALRPGGVCVVLEPGRGHGRVSAEIDAAFDVTDKDMPPVHVCRVAKKVGFSRCRTAPAPQHLGKALYANRSVGGWRGALLSLPLMRSSAVQAVLLWQRHYCGVSLLYKD